MDDNCGTCPKCGGELKISQNPKLLYECSDYECDYREFMWVGIPKAGKAKEDGCQNSKKSSSTG